MHYSDDELARYRKNREQLAEHDVFATHLSACAECRENLALFDEMEAAFASAEVWGAVPIFTQRPAGIVQLLAERDKIERQNAEALRRLFLQTTEHDGLQLRRDIGSDVAGSGGRGGEHGGAHLGHAFAIERKPIREQLEQQHADRPNIGAFVHARRREHLLR